MKFSAFCDVKFLLKFTSLGLYYFVNIGAGENGWYIYIYFSNFLSYLGLFVI